jgi:hypothetical protein
MSALCHRDRCTAANSNATSGPVDAQRTLRGCYGDNHGGDLATKDTSTEERPHFRLNRFLTSCPEIISVKDNRVSGTVGAALPLATAGVLANGG